MVSAAPSGTSRQARERGPDAGALEVAAAAEAVGQGEPGERAVDRLADVEARQRLVGVRLAAVEVDDRLQRDRDALARRTGARARRSAPSAARPVSRGPT